MSIRVRRTLGALLSLAAVLAATTVLTAPPASADCRVKDVYELTDRGKWASYDSLYVPPSTGPVTQTIRTTRSHSASVELGFSTQASVQAVLAEVNTQLNTSFTETVTVEQGRETSVTAPPSGARQEIRFGVFLQEIAIYEEYWGCPPGSPDRTLTARTVDVPKEAAGVFGV